MLFWFFLSVLFISCYILIRYRDDIDECIGLIFVVIPLVLSVLGLTISFVVFIGEGTFAQDAHVAEMSEKRSALIYQAENCDYNDPFRLSRYKLISKIQDWNEDLARHKKLQNNFWVGIYYPNIYDQFEPIDYEIVGGNSKWKLSEGVPAAENGLD